MSSPNSFICQSSMRAHGYLVTGCMILLVGCSSSDRGFVTGTVSVNGKPVGPGTITLEPIEGGPGAHAKFAEDGKFKVTSSGKKEGAQVGEYRVAIIGGDNVDELADPKGRAIIPAKYGDSSKSDLTLNVEAGAKEVNFDLKP
jgi:hypothetical protein